MPIGSKLRALRQAHHMTLEEVAQKLGTSRQTIHRYENGVIANIPSERVEALAEVYGTTPAALMGWDEEGLPAYPGILSITRHSVPILGDIACGEPVFAEEQCEGYAIAGDDFAADFCLRARGDSMIGARIYDGDLVFVTSQNSVDNGEIAVVVIDGEATLKRVYYYPAEQKLILSPENPRYAPLVYIGSELDQIRILGKATAFQSQIR